MGIIIIIATLLGGLAAIIYFWEKIFGRIKKIFRGRSQKGWKGIVLEGRYFAWEGPQLHFLKDIPPGTSPPQLLGKLNSMGFTACYGLKDRLEPHLAKGFLQVFETDRSTWKKALLLDDGEQVMMVKPPKDE